VDTTYLVLFNLAVVSVTYFRIAKQIAVHRKIASEKGVAPFQFSSFLWSLLLPAIPFGLYFVFRLSTMTFAWFPFVVLLCYVPAAYLAGEIADKIERGYDFQRKVAHKFKEIEFFTYLCGAYWLLLWIVGFFLTRDLR